MANLIKPDTLEDDMGSIDDELIDECEERVDQLRAELEQVTNNGLRFVQQAADAEAKLEQVKKERDELLKTNVKCASSLFITQKALELACDVIDNEEELTIAHSEDNPYSGLVDYFLKKASEK